MDFGLFPPPIRPLHPAGRALLTSNAVGIASLLFPQGRFRNIIAFPALLWIAYDVRQHGTGFVGSDYQDAVDLSMAFIRLVDFSILRVAELSVHRVRPDGSFETTEDVFNMTIYQKFRWSIDLFLTLRGIKWDWRVKNVDQVSPKISRR